MHIHSYIHIFISYTPFCITCCFIFVPIFFCLFHFLFLAFFFSHFFCFFLCFFSYTWYIFSFFLRLFLTFHLYFCLSFLRFFVVFPRTKVISVYLNDFLHVQRGMTVKQATLVVTMFGMASTFGQLAGAKIGQHLYNRSPKLQTLLMGVR